MICVRSTGDINLDELEKALVKGRWADEARIDGTQWFSKSQLPPSWIQFIAELPWWANLGLGAAASAIAQGYLNEAGKTLWSCQAKIATRVSEKVVSLAHALIYLQPLLQPHSKICIGVPGSDEAWPIILDLENFTVDSIALQIAALCYHSDALAEFTSSELYSPALSGWMKVHPDGTLVLSWQDSNTLQSASTEFPV